jgi:hypothetical protein
MEIFTGCEDAPHAFVILSMPMIDAAICMAPNKEYIEAFSHILHGFGQVTGLVANVQKSKVVPIRCR